MQPDRIGRYRVVRRIGEGGMGVVFEGHDDRLDRAVAIKVIRPELFADPVAQNRFRHEARAAARVNHPNICALYEFDEDQGQPYLVMELLAGEPLSSRILRGPLPAGELFRTSAQILDALAALHGSGVIHRDLKPANIYLTPHGAKLMDFGLAQPSATDSATQIALTGVGAVVGTPQYMSPERLFGQPADERADVWAAAAIIYEAAGGTAAFRGATLAAVIQAISREEPPPLSDRRLAPLDQALRGGLMKDPARRIATAGELSARVAAAAGVGGDTGAAAISMTGARTPAAMSAPQTRFVALPLRVLRPDPETDFLAFSVPDAVSASLSSLESLIVRAPRAVPPGDVDARAIGRDWAVDVVLTGTLMRAGSAVRVSAQLVDAADGTLRWSETAQAPLTDLFQLQDALTTRIVSSLHLPLSGRDRRALERQAPANPEAYELHMRAKQAMTNTARWPEARDLYERAVALDPSYAPAWVGLGNALRVLDKWEGKASGLLPRAQAALSRALVLDPDLAAAHHLAALVDVEIGRAPEAMARLLERAATRPREAALMSGLVIACRYAGMLEASVTAHARAVSIDPESRTSVCWSHFYLGDYAAAIRADRASLPFCAHMSRMMTGEAGSRAMVELEKSLSGHFQMATSVYRHILEGDIAGAMTLHRTLQAGGFTDPEMYFLVATFLAHRGVVDETLGVLAESVDSGFVGYQQLVDRDHWAPLRSHPRFIELLNRERGLWEHSRQLYVRAGGPAILG